MIWYHPEVELSLHQFPQMGRYDLFIWMICLLVECHLDKIPNVVMSSSSGTTGPNDSISIGV